MVVLWGYRECIAMPLYARESGGAANALDLGLIPPPGTSSPPSTTMTKIPCIFSSGALSPGTVLPSVGHENYPSSIRVGAATVNLDTKLDAENRALCHSPRSIYWKFSAAIFGPDIFLNENRRRRNAPR